MASRLTPARRERLIKLLSEGFGPTTVANELGISRNTVYRVKAGLGRFNRPSDAENAPPPKACVRDLSAEALRCLRDFPRFCRRYFPREPLWRWQIEAVTHMLGGDHRMVLAPPRHGKTHAFSVLAVVWLLCGGGHSDDYYDNPDAPLRDAQIMAVARSEDQAGKNFLAVSARLVMNELLIQDFGRFREPGLVWQESRGALIVAGRQRDILSGDYSYCTIGSRSPVLGRGATDQLLDDPFTLVNSRTENARADTMEWVRSEIFSRLEPGGRIWVMGARLPVPNEPYGALEDLPLDFADDQEETLDNDGFARLFATKVFQPILDHDKRTLLAPERWTWDGLMKAKARAGADVWEAMWCQSRNISGVGLARREWIYGSDGYRGILDNERIIGKSEPILGPDEEPRPTVRLMSIDPSPTKYAGALLMDIPLGQLEYAPQIIDIERGRMTTPNLIELMWRWWKLYQFRVLIVELNVEHALIDFPDFQEFKHRSGVKLIPHQTHAQNKPDPDWGLPTLSVDIELGRIRVPWGDAEARGKFLILVRELLEEVPTTDTVMALWFPKFNLSGLQALRPGGSGWVGYGHGGGRDRGPIPPPPRLMRGEGPASSPGGLKPLWWEKNVQG